MKEYKPISNDDTEFKLDGFYPFSYRDFSGFNQGDYIYCRDELFDGNVFDDDIEEIFLRMAQQRVDDMTFEVETAYPQKIIEFLDSQISLMRKKSIEQCKTLLHSRSVADRINDFDNIIIKTKINDKEISMQCNEMMKLINENSIKDIKQILLEQAQNDNLNDESHQHQRITRRK